MAIVTFESFQKSLRDVYIDVIRQCIKDSLKSELWKSEDLYWLGFIHEQDKFYVSDSLGRLKKSKGNSSQLFDYLESYKINDEHFPKQKVSRLNDAFDDLLNPGLEVDFDEDEIDQEEFEEAKSELRTLAGLVALSIFAIEIQNDPKKLKVSCHPSFHINVSHDIEAPLFSAKPPSILYDDEVIDLALCSLTKQESTKALFRKIIGAAGKKKSPSIQEILALKNDK